jgi:signal transduction histidine kinase
MPSREHEVVVVTVRDTGIGMTSPSTRKAFFDFYNRYSRTPDSPDHGLTICRRIGGAARRRIWAESAGEGMGSTIIFTLQAIEGP